MSVTNDLERADARVASDQDARVPGTSDSTDAAHEHPHDHAGAAGRGDAYWQAVLRASGRRVTQQRLAVLDALDRAPHSTIEHVHALAAQRLPQLTLQGVYLMLGDLETAGIVRRFDAVRSAVRYETRVGDNHHHLLCRVCARIVDVDCVIGEAPCLTPSSTHGFSVESAEVVFRGVCADCVRAGEGAATAAS